MAGVEAPEGDQKLMALSTRLSGTLFVYYIGILALSSYYALGFLLWSGPPQSRGPLIFCILLSLVGSTVFYSRKLYKACISNSYNFKDGSSVQMLGTFVFFALRPVFGASFAVITHMIWESTIMSSVSQFTQFSPTHFYISGILGFFVGFLAGRVLTKMEASGDKHLKGIW